MGLRLRVSDHRSPGRGTGVAFRHEHTLGRIRQIQRFRSSIPFRAGELSPYLSSSLPFCVRFNQRLRRNRLIRWLQHSIPGLWLAATRAGFHPLVIKPFPVRTSTRLFVPGRLVRGRPSPVRPTVILSHRSAGGNLFLGTSFCRSGATTGADVLFLRGPQSSGIGSAAVGKKMEGRKMGTSSESGGSHPIFCRPGFLSLQFRVLEFRTFQRPRMSGHE